ncbi:MAG: DUF4422 domain-containing protein, partial [Clostridia bacterium]|nr:DUF4422 domain-containing protein [Clostridia bacterium]
YSKCHNGSDLNVIAKIIKDLYPNYLESYYECLNQRKASYYNRLLGRGTRQVCRKTGSKTEERKFPRQAG